jgi:phenylacetate-coenzyme A ligase PaaK-like adenylate-forming protein
MTLTEATETFSGSPQGAEPDLHVAERSRGRLASVPELAGRYADLGIASLSDLTRVPVMDKDQLNLALAALEPKAERGATWLFQSGGSTGAPKVGYAPTGFYMEGVFAQWRPLAPEDVFVNAWGAGRMWGAHFLAAALADLSQCRVISVGAVTKEEYADWIGFFGSREVTAIGGTPSVLRLWFAHARAAGLRLPALRKVLWLGEAWHPQLDDDLAAVAPDAQRWGMFGSTETWVVGTNTPDCDVDVFHPLPDQLVHVGADTLLDFTTLNPEMLNPILRYQTGDAGEFAYCSCGDPARALRILGRRDSVVQVRGLGLHVDDLVERAEREPGVARAQVLITHQDGRVSGVQVDLLLDSSATPDLAERLRAELFASTFTLSTAFLHDPASFEVRVEETLLTNDRTGKTANFLLREGT